MSDEPRLGKLDNAQPYTDAQLASIAEAARPFVLGPKDAGKVYCPFCKLREARWRRSFDPNAPRIVDLFVYCTQCHKTGVTKLDLDARPVTRFPFLLIPIAILWAFVVFQLRSPIVGADGIQYSIDARAGEALWNPHHLLYTGFLASVFAVANAITSVDLLDLARATSAAWFAVLIIAVAIAVARRADERRLPAIAAFAVAATFGFQFLATQPEPYVASIACATLAFAFVNPDRSDNGRGSAIVAVIALALAALFHQLAVAVGLAIVIEAALRGGSAFRRAIGVCGAAALVVIAAYLLAWRADERDEAFLAFLTRYSSQDREGWGDVAHLSASGLAALGNSWKESLFGLGRVGAGPASGFLAIGFFAIVLVLAFVRIGRAPRRRPSLTACLAMAATYQVFFLWWLPSQPKYQLFVVIPWLVVARAAIVESLAKSRGIALERIVVVGLVLANLLFCLMPERSSRHLPRERAAAVARAAGDRGVVVCDTETVQFVAWDFPGVGYVPAPLALANAGNGTLENSIGSEYDPLVTANRIVVPLLELKPTYIGGGLLRTSNEQVWIPYLRWIFGVRPDSSTTETRRRFEVVKLANGEFALALEQGRVALSGTSEIVDDIDRALVEASDGATPFSFATFFESAGWSRK